MEKNEAIDVCIEDLVQAIILQAVEDYREALEILAWYREQKKKEKAHRRKQRKAHKKREASNHEPEPEDETAREEKERMRLKAEQKRRKRDEMIRKARWMKKDVERFFRSKWFAKMSELDPEKIMDAVKRGEVKNIAEDDEV